MHYLYKITNLINGKIYIGQTIQPNRRWYQHRADSVRNKYPIHHAIKKYGAENFIFEIIACCKTQEDANYTEEQLIQQYDCLSSGDKGYNVHPGGFSTSPSLETRQKMSESSPKYWLGKHLSEETKQKISEGRLSYFETHDGYWKGKEFSDEMKENFSKARLGKRTGKDNPMFGQTRPDSVKEAISKANKGRIPWNKGLKKKFI